MRHEFGCRDLIVPPQQASANSGRRRSRTERFASSSDPPGKPRTYPLGAKKIRWIKAAD
jgi:hypothetical protein